METSEDPQDASEAPPAMVGDGPPPPTTIGSPGDNTLVGHHTRQSSSGVDPYAWQTAGRSHGNNLKKRRDQPSPPTRTRELKNTRTSSPQEATHVPKAHKPLGKYARLTPKPSSSSTATRSARAPVSERSSAPTDLLGPLLDLSATVATRGQAEALLNMVRKH